MTEIRFYDDPSSEMATVYLNASNIMMGNYWDFHPGCMGCDLHIILGRRFGWNVSSPEALVRSLEAMLKFLERPFKTTKIQDIYGLDGFTKAPEIILESEPKKEKPLGLKKIEKMSDDQVRAFIDEYLARTF